MFHLLNHSSFSGSTISAVKTLMKLSALLSTMLLHSLPLSLRKANLGQFEKLLANTLVANSNLQWRRCRRINAYLPKRRAQFPRQPRHLRLRRRLDPFLVHSQRNSRRSHPICRSRRSHQLPRCSTNPVPCRTTYCYRPRSGRLDP